MSKKIFIFDGTNQHNPAAWLRINSPEKETEDIFISLKERALGLITIYKNP